MDTALKPEVETAARHGIGANKPPLKDVLTEQYATLLKDEAALIASFGRTPETVGDDEILGKVGRLVVLLRDVKKRAEAAHKVEKEPYLKGGREVDVFFNSIAAHALEAISKLERRQGVYLDAKEARERKAQQEREAAASAEADAQLKAAQAAATAGDQVRSELALEQAVQADDTAADAARQATAKPADVVRTHTGSGVTVSAQEDWNFEITDRSAIPLDALRDHIKASEIDDAVKRFVKAGGRDLAGVRIFEGRKVLNR